MVDHADIDHTGLAGVGGSVATHEAASDPHTGYRLESADQTLGAASATRTAGNVTTTSTTLVDVTSLAVSSVVTTGGVVMLVFEADVGQSEATSQIWFDVLRDGATLMGGSSRGLGSVRATNGSEVFHMSIVHFDAVAAGTHAWKVQFASSSGSGTATVYGDNTNRIARFWVRELPVKGVTS